MYYAVHPMLKAEFNDFECTCIQVCSSPPHLLFEHASPPPARAQLPAPSGERPRTCFRCQRVAFPSEFIRTVSSHVEPSRSCFLHLAWRVWVPPSCVCICGVICLFVCLITDHIPWRGPATFYFSIHKLIDFGLLTVWGHYQ